MIIELNIKLNINQVNSILKCLGYVNTILTTLGQPSRLDLHQAIVTISQQAQEQMSEPGLATAPAAPQPNGQPPEPEPEAKLPKG